ncbi:hypothetical protein, partial [Solemya velum gill symbiont]|uniref:hypothetical protein n=1 Tax=Solemya velum gill symbiont TaxID=2340 RepID=UPI00117B6E4F
MILSGDFYQLPPVANTLLGDPGKPCFSSPWFDECFPHIVCLKIIHQQSETNLINCINELEKGEISNESLELINSLSRPMNEEDSCVQLFARNVDVDLFNYNKLLNLTGELKVYKAHDEGDQHYLSKMIAPKNLGLKVGCPVMLLKNLTDSL